eukprot:6255597-Prymnesium_polylepis.1
MRVLEASARYLDVSVRSLAARRRNRTLRRRHASAADDAVARVVGDAERDGRGEVPAAEEAVEEGVLHLARVDADER